MDKATWLGTTPGMALTHEVVPMPVAAVRATAVEHNAAVMAEFCRRSGAELMPHAKTSLSPELAALQVRHGATGMTVATPFQALRAWSWGIDQVFVANEITAATELARLLEARTGPRRLWHYVDSPEGVRIAVEAARMAGAGAPVEVLVELGHRAGRTGARTVEAAMAVAELTAGRPELRLVGAAGYEGLLGGDRDDTTMALVDGFLGTLAELADRIRPLVDGPLVVSAGGSAHFDQVTARLGPTVAPGRSGNGDGRLVLRSGCYLTHDHGLYQRRSPASSPEWPLAPLRPAIEIWARVLSRPEPGLVLVNAGRRDLSHDAGLPVPLATAPPAFAANRRPVEGWAVTGLSDQHTFVSVPARNPVAVGDLVVLGISHPCTTFDRWSTLWLVDDDDRILSALSTTFP